ncbi:WG repeat-containing protein [bacterium]|nr:WG repeat-containing protein [bacterium]
MKNLIITITLSLLAVLFFYMDEASRANKKVMYVLSHDNGKESLLFDDFSEALPPVFDDVFTMQDGLMRAMKNGYSVIVTEKGKILPGEYLHINEFKEELSSVKSKDNKCGFIDRSGKVVIPLEYEDAGNFSEGFAPVKKEGKWGYISKSGEVKIPFEFDEASDFSEEYAVVSQNRKAGFIDKNGVSPTGFVFDSGEPFRYGVAVVKNGDENHVINKKWETIYVSKSHVFPFHIGENVISLKFFSFPPLVKNGEIILRESDADKVFTPVSGSLILFKKNDKYGAIDTNGNIVVPANFDNLDEVTKDKNYVKIKETRDKKTLSNKDVSVYNENGKYGLTDQEAIKKIESADFYNVCGFVDGFAHVEKNGHSFLIDKTGTPVLNGKHLRRVDWKDIYACGRRGDFGWW